MKRFNITYTNTTTGDSTIFTDVFARTAARARESSDKKFANIKKIKKSDIDAHHTIVILQVNDELTEEIRSIADVRGGATD